MIKMDHLKFLKEDYQLKVKECQRILNDKSIDDNKRVRVSAKLSCYRTFIVEMEQILKGND